MFDVKRSIRILAAFLVNLASIKTFISFVYRLNEFWISFVKYLFIMNDLIELYGYFTPIFDVKRSVRSLGFFLMNLVSV